MCQQIIISSYVRVTIEGSVQVTRYRRFWTRFFSILGLEVGGSLDFFERYRENKRKTERESGMKCKKVKEQLKYEKLINK